MSSNKKILIGLIGIALIYLLVIKFLSMNKSPITLFYLDRDTFSHEIKAISDERLFFLRHYELSSKMELNKSIYNKVFLEIPEINSSLMYQIVTNNNSYNQFDSSFVFVPINYSYAEFILAKLSENPRKEFHELSEILLKAKNDEIVLYLKYEKENGWFDFKNEVERYKLKSDQLDKLVE